MEHVSKLAKPTDIEKGYFEKKYEKEKEEREKARELKEKQELNKRGNMYQQKAQSNTVANKTGTSMSGINDTNADKKSKTKNLND